MAVSSINSAAAPSVAANPLKGRTVNQDDFLKLLITQLQNQDPLQPMDNQQFAAQLAQFNSLGQLIEINDKLGALSSGQSATSQYNAASLIGKEIAAAGNQVGLSAGSPATVGYQLGANAAKVVVNIYNSAGEVIRRIDAGSRGAGAQSLAWDGADSTGKRVAPGVYGFAVGAFDINGKAVPAAGKIQGVVSGVRLDGPEPVLEVNGVDVPMSGVMAVRASR